MQSILGQFYSGQLRFFRQLCTAAKVETVSQLALKTLEEGKCIVIGLQSTGQLVSCAMACNTIIHTIMRYHQLGKRQHVGVLVLKILGVS